MNKTKQLTGLALFTTIVVVLQLLGSFIRFGTFSISLVLIPIVVGAALYGVVAGAWLGFVFGVAVLLSGDASVFMAINPLGTVATVLLKGAAAGFFAGLAFKATEKFNTYAAVVVSAVVCPVVNTGVFLLGCGLFFMDAIRDMAAAANYEGSIVTFLLVFFVGLNFLFELLFNVILSPIILRLINLGRKT